MEGLACNVIHDRGHEMTFDKDPLILQKEVTGDLHKKT